MRLWSLNKLMRAVNLWRDGLTISEIAERLNVAPETVEKNLPEMRKLGLDKIA